MQQVPRALQCVPTSLTFSGPLQQLRVPPWISNSLMTHLLWQVLVLLEAVVLLTHLQKSGQKVLLRAGACKYAALTQHAQYFQEPSVTPRENDNACQILQNSCQAEGREWLIQYATWHKTNTEGSLAPVGKVSR